MVVTGGANKSLQNRSNFAPKSDPSRAENGGSQMTLPLHSKTFEVLCVVNWKGKPRAIDRSRRLRIKSNVMNALDEDIIILSYSDDLRNYGGVRHTTTKPRYYRKFRIFENAAQIRAKSPKSSQTESII